MHRSTMVATLERVVRLAGGQSALAAALTRRRAERGLADDVPVSPQRVANWLKRDKRLPVSVCPDIEALWGVSCEELAPHVDWAVLRAGSTHAASDNQLQQSSAAT